MINRSKDFVDEFEFFLDKFKRKENFNLLRFSDGELFIMLKKSIRLGRIFVKVDGSIKGIMNHPEWDRKDFDPVKDYEFSESLIKSFKYRSSEYYVGRSCKCCVDEKLWDKETSILGSDHDNITWSNILLNSNYPLFMDRFYPEIKKRKAFLICNEKANLSGHDWIIDTIKIKSNDFKNLEPINHIKKIIRDQNLKNQVFLFSASSFSNIAQYELAKFAPHNTYIDIGTTLSYELNIPAKRDYLKAYYEGGLNIKKCVWS